MRLAAELTGDIRSEPGIELIADTEVEDSRAVEAARERDIRRQRGQRRRIEDMAAQRFVAEADVAAQIPAAEFRDRRRRLRDDRRHVGGTRRLCADDECRSRECCKSYADHGFVLSLRRPAGRAPMNRCRTMA